MKYSFLPLSVIILISIPQLGSCGHEHVWFDATCTEPATCSVCQKAEGTAPGHSWQDATCTEPATCERCGETNGEANGHAWSKAGYMIPAVCEICSEEGDVRPNYFEEKGLPAPVEDSEIFDSQRLSVPYMIYNPNDSTSFKTKEGDCMLLVTIEEGPDNTSLYTIRTAAYLDAEWDNPEGSASLSDAMSMVAINQGLADIYTGVWLNENYSSGGDSYRSKQTLNIDGEEIVLKWTSTVSWDKFAWDQGSDGIWTRSHVCYITTMLSAPADYDGLLLGFLPYTRALTQEESEDALKNEDNDTVSYVDDMGRYGNYGEVGIFYRLCQ